MRGARHTLAGAVTVAVAAVLATTAVTVGSAAGASTATAIATTGPVTGATGAHDPTMARQGDTWFLFSTGPGLPMRRSVDRRHWEDAGQVFPDGLPAWVHEQVPELGPTRDAWAPDVSYVDGRWHLYWSIAVFGTQHAVTGLATNVTLDPTDPAYHWVDEGPVLTSTAGDPYTAIDANAVTDEHGGRWLVWGSFWDGIALQPLDRATGKPQPGSPTINLARRDPWWLGVEGAFVVHHGGYWWLFASFGFCCRGVDSFYSVHVGRSTSLTGPYRDAAGVDLLAGGGTTLTGSYDDVVGPGHGSVLADGADWLLVHHYYDRANQGAPTLSIRPLLWGPDGWPVAADPGFTTGPPTTADVTGEWALRGYAEEQPARLPEDVRVTLHADGTVSPRGSWRLDGEVVRIDGANADGASRRWWLVVDPAAGQGFGRDDRTAAVRATRLGPPSAPPPTGPAGTPGATPEPTATRSVGIATPRFTG